MTAEDVRHNVAPLDESASPDDVYIGARVGTERRKRYDLARVIGDFEDRAAFIVAACDAMAEKILGKSATAT